MSKLGLNFGHYNSEALFWRQSIHITVFGLRYWLLRDNYATKYELSNVAYIPDRHHKKIFQFQSFTLPLNIALDLAMYPELQSLGASLVS